MKKLNIWGPWDDNPSKSENFYGINENEEALEKIQESETEDKEDEEDELDDVDECSVKESNDPYEDILKDLK